MQAEFMSPNESFPHILVIDDDRDTAILLSELMEQSFNVKALRAKTHLEAIQILSDAKISLIVSDYFVPPNSGIDLLRMMEARGITTPITFISASPDAALLLRGHRRSIPLFDKFNWPTLANHVSENHFTLIEQKEIRQRGNR